MKMTKNFFGTLGRKVALNIAYNKNEETQQYRYFDNVIKEKLYAPHQTVGEVKAK